MGAIEVKVPRTKDKRKGGDKVRFNSQILPPYLRRTKSLDELIPWLYLKELSTGDFSEALPKLFGKTRRQRCTVHKTVNVFDKLPKSAQKRALSHLHEIWMD